MPVSGSMSCHPLGGQQCLSQDPCCAIPLGNSNACLRIHVVSSPWGTWACSLLPKMCACYSCLIAYAQILNVMGAPFEHVDILADESLRVGMKEYSQWPTFPQ
eukprot:scaffold236357_cov14-Tisochrysis_lutea.AAC.1